MSIAAAASFAVFYHPGTANPAPGFAIDPALLDQPTQTVAAYSLSFLGTPDPAAGFAGSALAARRTLFNGHGPRNPALSAGSGMAGGTLDLAIPAGTHTDVAMLVTSADLGGLTQLVLDRFADVRLKLGDTAPGPAAAGDALQVGLTIARTGLVDATQSSRSVDLSLVLAPDGPRPPDNIAVQASGFGDSIAVGQGGARLATSRLGALAITGGAGDDRIDLSSTNGLGGTGVSAIIRPGGDHGSFATGGTAAVGFAAAGSTHDQLAQWWTTGAAALAGFSLTGRVDVGIPGQEIDATIAAATDLPGDKGYWDHPAALGPAGMFTSTGDFLLSPATALAWGLPAGASLLDHVFNSGPGTPYFAFPTAAGIGIARPGTFDYAGSGQDSTNFEISGGYTDWLAGGRTGGHDEIGLSWDAAASGQALAATVQVALLQDGQSVGVALFSHGAQVWSGSLAAVDPAGGFAPGNASIATINVDPGVAFDEMRFLGTPGGGDFLLSGVRLTLAANTTQVSGGDQVSLSDLAGAGPARLLYDAAGSGDGVDRYDHFNLGRGDQLTIDHTDLAHLQVTTTNGGHDLAVRFIDNPGGLILLAGAGDGFDVSSLSTLVQAGHSEVALALNPVFV